MHIRDLFLSIKGHVNEGYIVSYELIDQGNYPDFTITFSIRKRSTS